MCVHVHFTNKVCFQDPQKSVRGLRLGFNVDVRYGFRLGLGLVMVRGWEMYYVYEGPHKDRRLRMTVYVFFPQYFNLVTRKKAENKMEYKRVGMKMITWVDLVSF